ncbi:MAG: ISKra4 family transposase [Fusobacteriaceae bacterium]
MTSLGKIEYLRDYYYCRKCNTGLYFYDEENKIPSGKYTKKILEKICVMGETESFEVASDKLKKLLDLEVSPKEIEIISEKIGNYFYINEEEEANIFQNNPNLINMKSVPNRSKERIYVSADGSMVNTKAGWKEVKLGVIFSEKDLLSSTEKRKFIYKKEYIATFKDVNTFRPLFLNTARKIGIESAKQVVFLGDGAIWIWNMAEEDFPSAIQILDWYHAKEHVFDCGKAIFQNDNQEALLWCKSMETLLWNEELEELFEKLNPDNFEKAYQKEAIIKLSTYLKNNETRIHYKTYRDNGLTIGSGSIESAHKFVIQKRLKQSGMRWTNYGGQAIVHLRSLYYSKKWDESFKNIDMRAALAS